LKRHAPDATAIQDVINSYWNQGNVRLHLLTDEELPFHNDVIGKPSAGGTGNTDYDLVKNGYFGTHDERTKVPSNCPPGIQNTNFCISSLLTAKRQAFHYVLFTHKQSATSTSSGYSEIPGNDIDISLGGFTGGVGNTMQQEGTSMHELGHNLGLNHGGPILIGGVSQTDNSWNCKPNYPSVMNYAYQFTNYVNSRPLDFSHGNFGPLNPTLPVDSSGLTGNQGMGIAWNSASTSGSVHTGTASGAVDWDWDNEARDGVSSTISLDEFGGTSGCPTANPGSNLLDHNDWANFVFGFQTYSSFGDGASVYYNVNTDGNFVDNNNQNPTTNPDDLKKDKYKQQKMNSQDEQDNGGMNRTNDLAGLSYRVESLEKDIAQLKDSSFEYKTPVINSTGETKTASYAASNGGYVTTTDYVQKGSEQIAPTKPKGQLEKDLGDLDLLILQGGEYGAIAKTQQIIEKITGSPDGSPPLISDPYDRSRVLLTLDNILASIIQDSQTNYKPPISIKEIITDLFWVWVLIGIVIGLIIIASIFAHQYRKSRREAIRS
jgi:hypothetical protein